MTALDWKGEPIWVCPDCDADVTSVYDDGFEDGQDDGRLQVYREIAQVDPESQEADRSWCVFCSVSQISVSSEPLRHRDDCLWLKAKYAVAKPVI